MYSVFISHVDFSLEITTNYIVTFLNNKMIFPFYLDILYTKETAMLLLDEIAINWERG